jgi:hypothetical protein
MRSSADCITTTCESEFSIQTTRRSRVLSRLSVACWRCQFWADCTINILERKVSDRDTLVLRHQLNVLRRKSPKRLAFGNVDRLVFAGLYRVAPGVLDALKILKPQRHLSFPKIRSRSPCPFRKFDPAWKGACRPYALRYSVSIQAWAYMKLIRQIVLTVT